MKSGVRTRRHAPAPNWTRRGSPALASPDTDRPDAALAASVAMSGHSSQPGEHPLPMRLGSATVAVASTNTIAMASAHGPPTVPTPSASASQREPSPDRRRGPPADHPPVVGAGRHPPRRLDRVRDERDVRERQHRDRPRRHSIVLVCLSMSRQASSARQTHAPCSHRSADAVARPSLAVPAPSVAGVSTAIATITLRKAEPAPNDHRAASRT